jgi:tRNA splicing endonuclease
MLFMVIEPFKDVKAVYRRLREKGRMMLEGLRYIGSWVEADYHRCFQLMECDNTSSFQKWVVQWQDLVSFEVVPVVESEQAAKMIRPFL